MITDLTKDHFGRLYFTIGGKRIVMRVTPHNSERFFAFAKEQGVDDATNAAKHWTDHVKNTHEERKKILEIALNPVPNETQLTTTDIDTHFDLNEIMALSGHWLGMLQRTELDPNAVKLAAAAR